MNNRIIGAKGLSGILEALLRGLFFLGIAIDVTLPFTLSRVLSWMFFGPITHRFYWQAFWFILVFGVLMVVFVHFTARIFHTINRGDSFVEENLHSLGVLSMLSMLLCVDCGVYASLGVSILAFILCMAFLFFGGFLLVLRELFRAAVTFKLENDFTV